MDRQCLLFLHLQQIASISFDSNDLTYLLTQNANCLSSSSAAWIFWDHIESIFYTWCKGVSEIFTRGASGESYRECDRDYWDSRSSPAANSWEWRHAFRWQTARDDRVTRWPDCKNLSFLVSSLICFRIRLCLDFGFIEGFRGKEKQREDRQN